VRLALGAAALVVAATLLDDALAPGRFANDRPPAVYAGAAVLASALLMLAPRVRSRAVSLGAGIAAGGALATLVTGLAWSGGVPDPLEHGGIAFNVADVAIGLGDALLVGGALWHAARHRDRLREAI
jgi:lipoprotein signal peptidase